MEKRACIARTILCLAISCLALGACDASLREGNCPESFGSEDQARKVILSYFQDFSQDAEHTIDEMLDIIDLPRSGQNRKALAARLLQAFSTAAIEVRKDRAGKLGWIVSYERDNHFIQLIIKCSKRVVVTDYITQH